MSASNTPALWLGGSAAPGRNYSDLTAAGTNWFSLAGGSVLKVYSADILYDSDAQLSQLFTYLKLHNIKLAIEFYSVTAGPGESGEGLASATDAAAMAARVQSLGGSIDYVQMDEALYRAHDVYGHSIADVAANVAVNVAAIRAVFPNVSVGDIEPFPSPNSIPDLQAWFAAYQAATGTPLISFTPDVEWNNPDWQTQLEALSSTLQGDGIKLSVIFNGDDSAQSSNQWGAEAEQRMAAVMSDPKIHLDNAIIQTWQPFPTAATPGDVPGTIVNVGICTSMLSSLYSAGLLGFTSSSSIAASESIAVKDGSPISGMVLRLGAIDIAAGIDVAIILITQSTDLCASQVGNGMVHGSGTTTLLLFGNQAEVNAELATVRVSSPLAGDDTMLMELFDATGWLANCQIELSSIPATGTTTPPPPTIGLAISSDSGVIGDDITGVLRPTFTGTAAAGSRVTVQIDGQPAGSVQTSATGAWTYISAAALAYGAHTVSVVAIDAAGNSSVPAALAIAINAYAPVQPMLMLAARSDSGFPGDDITDVNKPIFSGTAPLSTSIDLRIDGVAVGLVAVSKTGSWNATLTNPLALGIHTVTAATVDAFGNESAFNSLAVTIDTPAQETAAQTSSDPLFDAAWYLKQYPSVAASGMNPYTEFMTIGWKLGYDPDPLFNTTYYLNQNPDVAQAGVNPLTHFENYGWKEGRDPSEQFSVSAYEQANPATNGTDPLVAYITRSELGLPTSPIFSATPHAFSSDPLIDVNYYYSQYADVAASGASPDNDYMSAGGWQDGRNPDAFFNTAWYLQQYPDVAAAGINPLIHYELYGWKEGRDPSPEFSTSQYLAHNPDVAAAGVDPLLQYVTAGIAQGREIYPSVLALPTPTVHLSPGSDSGVKGDGVTNDMNPLLTGMAEAGCTVDVSIDGLLSETAVTNAAGVWLYAVTSPLSNGLHSISVSCADQASPTPTTMSLMIEATSPPPTIGLATSSDSGVIGDDITNVTRPTLTGRAAAGSTVTVQIDGKSAGSVQTSATGTWSYSPAANLTSGNHTVSAIATDKAANVSVPATMSLMIAAANAGSTFILSKGSDLVVGGSGNNTIIAASNILSSGDSINGGVGGTNTLVLSGAGTFNLQLPSQLINVQVIAAQEGPPAFGAIAAQNQIVTLRDGMDATVNIGPATLNAGNPPPATITIVGAHNSDVINLSSGNDVVTVGDVKETIHGGTGNDTIQVNANTIGASIDGYTGHSTIQVTGGGAIVMGSSIVNISSVVLASAPGNLSFIANAQAGLVVTDTSHGADTAQVGGVGQTLNGGSGHNTLVGLAGGATTFKDLAAAMNGDTIVNFDAGSDLIDLTNVSFASAKKSFVENGSGTAGTLSVSDGTHGASMALRGLFTPANFHLASDGAVGTAITYS
jgi:hypothetical protein